MLAYFPASAPLAQRPPVWSQNAYESHFMSTVHRWILGTKTHLPLSGEVTVTGGDTEDEGIEACELLGRDDGVVGFCRSVHLDENLLREGLGDPSEQVASDRRMRKTRRCDALEDGRLAAGISDTRLDGLGHCRHKL